MLRTHQSRQVEGANDPLTLDALPAGRSSLKDTSFFLPEHRWPSPSFVHMHADAAVASKLTVDALSSLVSQSSASKPNDTLVPRGYSQSCSSVHTPLACRMSYMCSTLASYRTYYGVTIAIPPVNV